MKKPFFTAALIGMLGITSLTGCSAPQNNQEASAVSVTESTVPEGEVEPAKEITFWCTKEDCFEELRKEFEEETGITVHATYMGGYDDMVNKVMAGIAGNNLPDLAQLGQRHGVAQIYDSGVLLPVEDYISQDIIDDILPGFWKRFTYKDKKVILPFQNSMPMLYYNKTLFEEQGIQIPETLDEVVETAKDIRDRSGNYGFTLSSDYPWYIMALMYNSSTAPLKNGEASMNSEEVKNICNKMRQMSIVDGSMPRNQHTTAQEDFSNGNIGMLMASCASYAKLQKLIDGKFELGIAMFPKVSTMDMTMGGNGLGMFRSTPEREKAATMFIEFMLEPERIAQGCLSSGYIAVTNESTNTETYQTYLQDPNRQVVNEQLQFLGGAPVSPIDSLVWNEVKGLIDSIEADESVNIEEKLNEIDEKIEKYMKEYEGH